MTTYTTTQWGTRALQKAAIVGEDEVPTATQIAWAVDVGTALFHECVAQGISFPGCSYSVLAGEYYDAFPTLVSYALKAEVGLMSEAEAEGAMQIAKNKLRIINAVPANNAPARAEYF